jgi:hypothetical protein
MRCLEKAPADRYASADELLADLDRLDLPDRWDVGHARRWWESHVSVPVPTRVSGSRPVVSVA